MKLPNILGKSQLKSRKFDYQPRFFDPKKEERELRRKEGKLQNDKSIEGSKQRISNSFKQKREYAAERKAISRKRNTRIIGIIFLLLVGFYFLIKEFLPLLLDSLTI